MVYDIYDDDTIIHYGMPKRSGRYPWGSGEDPYQRLGGKDQFLLRANELKEQGFTPAEIAKALGMKTTEYTARRSVVVNEQRAARQAEAHSLSEKGWSPTAIGKKMGLNESTVRSLLQPYRNANTQVSIQIANSLKKTIGEKGCIDIGTGTERYLGTSADKLKVAAQILKDEGYSVKNIRVPQMGTKEFTTVKVLASPNLETRDIYNDLGMIKSLATNIDNVKPGESLAQRNFVPVDESRVKIRYSDGTRSASDGAMKDGVIEINPNAKDLRLGNSKYAQVRIKVGETSYLKGMAMYGDPKDFPKGTDIIFNTNKDKSKSKREVLKDLKTDNNGNIDSENPFGATVHQFYYDDPKTGKKVLSPINIVNEEGTWHNWSRNLASQMLSKQPVSLAKQQLGISYERRKAELDEINSLTNSVVKKKLLEDYAESQDSAAVHLKAAAMPRQRTQVILPISSLKDNEIYAPNYKNGETVVLIRYPHGGTFEIPQLKVNNKNKEGRKYLGSAFDAVGINANVAEKLSGADFDGDSVLVIPNNNGAIKATKSLKGLKNFDPKTSYPAYEGMPKMTKRQRGMEMGMVSNLITDMTIKGAPPEDIVKAVRHSMVVIDAYKHNLNYRQSEKDNDIQALKNKYQAKEDTSKKGGGASTLISRATSEQRVAQRKLRSAKDGGYIDKDTGEVIYVPTGETYSVKKTNAKGEVTEKKVLRTISSTKMAETKDAYSLSSGEPIENVYAKYANNLKSLANQARKSYINTPDFKYDPAAKKRYSREVESLNAKLDIALKNAPLERKAQIVANSIFKAQTQDYNNLDAEDIKKLKNRALNRGRELVGAHKVSVNITDKEWEAIQAHAISANTLTKILNNSDTDRLRELATPKQYKEVPKYIQSRVKSLIDSGYTYSEVAEVMGISTSTVSNIIKPR